MKQTYHLCVNSSEKDNVETALKRIGVTPSTTVKMSDISGGVKLDYILDLSKYELLYLRLSCTTGKIINVSQYVKEVAD